MTTPSDPNADLFARLPTLEEQVEQERLRRREPGGPTLFRLRIWGVVLPLLLAGVAYTLYLPHVCPVLFVGDSGELIAAAAGGGIAHPPGYPLYVLLLQSWLALPWQSPSAWEPAVFGPAYGANLFSAFCGAASVGVVTLLLWRMSRHAVWAVLGGLIWMVTPALFSQSLIAEVYTFHALLVSLWLLCVHGVLEDARPVWVAGLTLLQGCLLAHHPSSILLAPATILVLITHGREVRYPTQTPWVIAIAAFVLGLSPYLSLPLRSLTEPYLDWGNPEDWTHFWEVVTRAHYREVIQSQSVENPIGIGGVIRAWSTWTWQQYGGLMLAGFIGIALAAKRGGRWVVLLVLTLLLSTIPYFWYFRGLKPVDLDYLEVYFFPSHLALLLLSLAGLIPIPGRRHPFATWQGAILALATLGMVANMWGYSRREYARRDSVIGSRFAFETLQSVPAQSILVCEGDEMLMYWYMQGVAKLQPEVILLEKDILFDPTTWYWESIGARYPDFVPPPMPDTSRLAQIGIDSLHGIRGYQVREIVRKNPGREVFLTGLSFNPANHTDIGTGLYGLLFQSLRGRDNGTDASAFHAQRLDPPDLEWLLAQSRTGRFDFYEDLLREKYLLTLISYGERAFQGGQFATAHRIYDFARELDPASTELLLGLGVTFLQLERWEEAGEVFQTLSDSDPADPFFAFALAVTHYHLGHMEQWRIEMARAQALDPENPILKNEMDLVRRFDAGDSPLAIFGGTEAPDEDAEAEPE